MLRGSEEAVRTILIVAANKPFGESLREQVAARGFAALLANTITEARRIACRSEVHDGIFEYLLPDGNGIELAQELRALDPQFCFGIINGPENFSAVLDSMRNGAVEYLLAPTAPESVTPVIAHFSKQKAPQPPPMDVQCTSLTGTSVAIQTVRDQICQIAGSDYPVLILGETGTGKELVARDIHNSSGRTGRFIPINCGELAPTLIETELFGHERGAFTGADRAREGLFKAADGGTIFLDEIGELSLELQSRLLRVLQEREVRAIGASSSRKVDVRVISATNLDLEEAVMHNRFRQDLLYRLNVVEIHVPPLRERREDIPELVSIFLDEIFERTGNRYAFSHTGLVHLTKSEWRGNIRELQHVVQRVCALSTSLRVDVEMVQRAKPSVVPPLRSVESKGLAGMEQIAILAALRSTGWNMAEAARKLGIARSTLYRKVKGDEGLSNALSGPQIET